MALPNASSTQGKACSAYNKVAVEKFSTCDILAHFLYFKKSRNPNSDQQATLYELALTKRLKEDEEYVENLQMALAEEQEKTKDMFEKLTSGNIYLFKEYPDEEVQVELATEETQTVAMEIELDSIYGKEIPPNSDLIIENSNLHKEIHKQNLLLERLNQECRIYEKEIDSLKSSLGNALKVATIIKDLEAVLKESTKQHITVQTETSPISNTYAQKLKFKPINTILVKNNDPNRSADAMGDEITKLGLDDIKITDCKKTTNGNLIVKCNSPKDLEQLRDKIHNSNLHNTTEVLNQTRRVMLFSIPADVTEENLEKVIQSKYPQMTSIKFIKKYIAKNVYHQSIQLDLNTALAFISDRKLLINFRSCPVRKYLSLKRCLRCQHTGHSVIDCNHQNFMETCEYCGGAHGSYKCKHKNNPESYRCANCVRDNRNGFEYDTSHSAGSHDCPSYLYRLKEFRNKQNSPQNKF